MHVCCEHPSVQIVQLVPTQVVDAMRTTISNMVGVLPPQHFDVTVSTVGENLAQLMFSVLMTGERPHRQLGTSL